ncbi:MAG TPA: hydrogenase maturation protease [Candidatus Acidoferrum sp.]|nr:hydrogenase maturation protease [Candidatus Acidoferrum sp.]
MNRILVIASGNPLRGDDGVGWHVAEALRQEPRTFGLAVKTVQQLTPELADEISQAEIVIFVDAAESQQQGSVAVVPLEQSPQSTAPFTHSLTPAAPFTHSLTPAALLSLARELYGKAPDKAFLVTVGASELDLSEELSAPVARGVAGALEAIRALVPSLR